VPESILEYLTTRTALERARDALDIFVIYYVIYRVLLLMRGTRAMQISMGLLIVLGVYLVAYQLNLVTVLSILGSLISSFILIVVVVFQSDIRRALMRVGSRWVGALGQAKESHVIDEVVEAVTELARHRIGALIALEQDANLDEFVGIHKGRMVDAAVSSELLVTLFLPEGMNKLHDGAVVIRNLRVAKAGVFFPLHEGRVLDQSFGSRHRAALGITEETDTVVVVVSEERGTISLCFGGNIASNLDGPKLRTALEANFSPKGRKKRKKPPATRATQTPLPANRVEVPEPAPPSEEPAPVLPKPEPAPKPIPRVTESEATRGLPSEPPPPLRPRAFPDEAGTVGGRSPTGARPISLDVRPMPRSGEGPALGPGEDEPPPSERSKN
jgi:diadenylate cyclase